MTGTASCRAAGCAALFELCPYLYRYPVAHWKQKQILGIRFILQVRLTTARGKFDDFFDPTQGWGNVLRPGNVDENLASLGNRHGCPCWLIRGNHIKYSWLQKFGLYAKAG